MTPTLTLLAAMWPGRVLAQAIDPLYLETFPKITTLRLEGCGACRSGAAMVRIPPSLRSIDDPADGSDLMLLDAEGAPVPFAVARGTASPDRRPLGTSPTRRPGELRVDAPRTAIDGIELALSDEGMVGRVTVYNLDTGRALTEPTLVWTHEVGAHRTVHFPPTRARLRVVFEWFGTPPKRRPLLIGLRSPSPSLEPDRFRAPVVDRRVSETGTVDYTIQLETPVPVAAIDLAAADASVISRSVRVETPSGTGQWQLPLGDGEIRRVRVGEATLDATRVLLDVPPPEDRFVVRVASEGQPVLDIPELGIELEGEAIWFQPSGPGPYTLLGGAPAQTRPPSEIQIALSELVLLPTVPVKLAPVEANSRYIHPVQRSGLAGPGRALPNPEAFAWTAAIEGASGMVRIPLEPEVQSAVGASGLEGLRLTEPAEPLRQIPHLLRRTPVDPVIEIDMSQVERIEDGGISRLIVPVPSPTLGVSTITLTTEAAAFKRQVTLLEPINDQLLPLRSVTWTGADRPGSLGIALDQTVGDRLIIELNNGDDPPLPITALQLARPGWELVALVPEGGALLHGGDPRRPAADFDLQLYADSLTEAARREATVGPLHTQVARPLSRADRASLLGGLVFLVAGLIAMTVRLLRSLPPPDPPTGQDGAATETAGAVASA